MHQHEFALQIERLRKTWPDLSKDIVSELWMRYKSLDPNLWTRICTDVIDYCKFSPRPAHFREAAERVLRTWRHSQDAKEKPECPDCRSGCGFQEVFYMVATQEGHNEMAYQGVVPCKSCNAALQYNKPRANITRFITEEQFRQYWKERQKIPLDKRCPAFAGENPEPYIHPATEEVTPKHIQEELEAVKQTLPPTSPQDPPPADDVPEDF